MHVLPNSKIPFSSLPLDVMISNRTAALKKKQETSMEDNKGAGVDSNYFLLDEFNFPHAVAIHESSLKAEPLIVTYKKCYMMCGLDRNPNAGVTIIVTPKWMFVSPLMGPYTHHQGMPVYIDGYAYTGIINVQVTEKEWPATAGLVEKTQLTPYEILEISSTKQQE
jgi:hypothetical protein